MENTDLILVNDKEAYLERRRRRGVGIKHSFLKFCALILLAGIVLCVVFLLPKVKEFLKEYNFGENFSPNSTGSIQQPNSQGGSNQNTQNPPEDDGQVGENDLEAIPNGAYKIESATTEYKITNETKIELEGSSPALISPYEIRSKYGGEAPLVLITNLAPKESYSNGKYYTTTDNFYSDNENINSLASLMAERLNALGIKTLYLDEEYSKGSVYGTLDEYEKSLGEMLSRYPSISYVFCISRGIYINDDMSQKSEVISNSGEKCAQIRIISGTNGEKLTESQRKNIDFALDFAEFSNKKINSFVAESKIAGFPLGQNISPLALEIELGTYANTYNEAHKSTIHLSNLIFEYLTNSDERI